MSTNQHANDAAVSARVLVTGASGFLGRRIVAALSGSGHGVRALVRETSNTQCLQFDNVSIAIGDIRDAASIEPAFRGVSCVVHAAADTTGSEAGGRETTIEGTRNVLDLCEQFGIAKLIYISSCSVYGTAGLNSFEVVDEESPLEGSAKLRGAYSWAKFEAERLVVARMSKGKIPIVCLRPGAVYGPLGEVFPPMIGYSLSNKVFVVIGLGKFVLPLVHVENVADAVLHSIKNDDANGQIMNIVDSDRITKRVYVNRLIRKIYPKCRAIYVPYGLISFVVSLQEMLFNVARRDPVLSKYRLHSSQSPVIIDGSKIMRRLNWNPPVNFDQAVEKWPDSPLQHSQEN